MPAIILYPIWRKFMKNLNLNKKKNARKHSAQKRFGLYMLAAFFIAGILLTACDMWGFYDDGIHYITGTEYDLYGYNKDGYDAAGYDIDGYNADGYDADGYNKDGYNAAGYDAEGYTADGYNANGYNRNGYKSLSDFTRVDSGIAFDWRI